MEDSHRWAHVTPNDHSGALYIITFVGFTYGGLTFLTRLMIKWHVLGLDDLAMLVAQVRSRYAIQHVPFYQLAHYNRSLVLHSLHYCLPLYRLD